MRLSIKMFVLWLCLTLFGCREETIHSRSDARRAPSDPNGAKIAEYRHELSNVLVHAVGNDEEGLRLLAFYRERAHYLLLTESGQWVVEGGTNQRRFGVGPDAARLDFAIAPATRLRRDRFGLQSQANFEYLRERSTVFIPPPETFTRLWLGIRTMHEISHVYDDLLGIERFVPGEEGEREFALGEVRAHSLEMRLLNQATYGAFERDLSALLGALVPSDSRPDAWIMPDIPTDFAQVFSLFPPPQSDAERDTRNGSCLIALNFLYADHQHDLTSPLDRRVRAFRTWRRIRHRL